MKKYQKAPIRILTNDGPLRANTFIPSNVYVHSLHHAICSEMVFVSVPRNGRVDETTSAV